MTKLTRVCGLIYDTPLMVRGSKLAEITAVVEAKRRAGDEDLDWEGESRRYEPQRVGSVAVLPLMGILARRMNMLMEWSGGTSTELYMQWFDDAVADPAVKTIVQLCCGPGGAVHGTPEAARRVYEARGKKRIISVADGPVASATFYIYAAGSEHIFVPSGEGGWIGVVMAHDDYSRMLANDGVERTFIYSSKYKVEGNEYEPLKPETEAYWKSQVMTLGDKFESDVAEFYGISVEEVKARFGDGRGLIAEQALAAGMCERIETFENLMAELTAEDATPLQEADPPAVLGSRGLLPAGAERRSIGGDVAAEADDGVSVEGTAVPFGSASQELRTPTGTAFREEIAEGAFAESLAAHDVRVQWQHDPRYVFGCTSAGTARVWEEKGVGVRYSATPPDAQWARDAMASIRRGDVSQCSFAFRVTPHKDGRPGDRWERRADGNLYRVVTHARLYEVGPQTQPAYLDTTVAVRGAEAFLAAENRVRAAGDLRRRKLALATKSVDLPTRRK